MLQLPRNGTHGKRVHKHMRYKISRNRSPVTPAMGAAFLMTDNQRTVRSQWMTLRTHSQYSERTSIPYEEEVLLDRKQHMFLPSKGYRYRPLDILTAHKNVTLCIDYMFVDKMVFLVTTSRNLHFLTIENITSRAIQ